MKKMTREQAKKTEKRIKLILVYNSILGRTPVKESIQRIKEVRNPKKVKPELIAPNLMGK
jgi:hypothetical protein